MKKMSCLFALFLLTAAVSKAQSFCDADFSIDVPGITFSAAMAWGDSAVYISITNNSGLNYAYPQAKLFNTSPLPPGMTLNSQYNYWFPFASSYNNGQTSVCPFGYDVSQAIPANYMVSFRLWLRPNDTAVGYDSCRFQQDFTLNLNPQTGIVEYEKGMSVTAFPNPSNTVVSFTAGENANDFYSAKIVSLEGQEIFSQTLSRGQLDISRLAEGMYFVLLFDDKGNPVGKSKVLKN